MSSKKKEIFLVRHGTTAYNEEDRLQGRIDNPLSEKGLAESGLLADALAGIPFSAVFSSPMQRAQTTAAILNKKRGLTVTTLAGLVEIDLGSWEGRIYGQVQLDDPDFYQRWLADEALPIPEGESFIQVYQRLEAPLREILIQEHETVLIVGHASVNRAILALLLKIPPAAARFFRCGNCHYSRFITYKGLGGDYTVLSAWNMPPGLKAVL